MTLRADKLTLALEEPSEPRQGRVTVPRTSANTNRRQTRSAVLAEEVLRLPVVKSPGGVSSWFDKCSVGPQ
jgi:hypothetical protein